MTKPKPHDDPKPKSEDADALDERLDEALEESFPASDPVAITPDHEKPKP
ncbi:hypothetical protein sos41_31740 [Alphaproteobacteria bacterium SO-S41]|nr:hypothetical protein sos41_31740 [Alphaproteobacteria bacterium SO-S41]